MNTSIGLGDRDALDTVGAALVFHAAVRALAFDNKSDIFDAALPRFVTIQDFDLPAFTIRVAAIHTKEFAREERGFVTT